MYMYLAVKVFGSSTVARFMNPSLFCLHQLAPSSNRVSWGKGGLNLEVYHDTFLVCPVYVIPSLSPPAAVGPPPALASISWSFLPSNPIPSVLSHIRSRDPGVSSVSQSSHITLTLSDTDTRVGAGRAAGGGGGVCGFDGQPGRRGGWLC